MRANASKTRKFGTIWVKAKGSATLRHIYINISGKFIKYIAYQIQDLRKSFPTAQHTHDFGKYEGDMRFQKSVRAEWLRPAKSQRRGATSKRWLVKLWKHFEKAQIILIWPKTINRTLRTRKSILPFNFRAYSRRGEGRSRDGVVPSLKEFFLSPLLSFFLNLFSRATM